MAPPLAMPHNMRPGTNGARNPFANGDPASIGRQMPIAPLPADPRQGQLARLGEGIRRAHAAGNAEHVRTLGTEYRRLQNELQGQMDQPSPGTQGGETVTLNIGGTRVQVDRSFLNLSPEDQARTVEEIAAQAGISDQGGPGGQESPLAAFRRKYPQYSDMDDAQLADAIYHRFYSDILREEFDRKLGTGGPLKLFTIEAPDGRKITIEADDEATALRGAQEWAESNPIDKGQSLTSPATGTPEMSDDGQSDPQARYNAALENVRAKYYPQLTDEQWQRAVQESPALKPYGGQELLTHGLTFGLADEAGALGNVMGNVFSGQDFGTMWSDFKELHEARRDLGRHQAGFAGGAAELAGGVLTGAPAVRAIAGAGSTASQIFKGIAGSGAMGAAYGAGATDGGLPDRAIGAGVGGALGVAGGVAAPLAAKGVQGVVRGARQTGLNIANRPLVRNAPTAQSIKRSAKSAYKEMEATGAVVQQPALSVLRQNMSNLLHREGLITPAGRVSTAYPKVTDAIASIEDFTTAPLGMKAAQVLHKSIRRVVKSTDPEESALGLRMLDAFEDWMDNLPPKSVSGNAAEAFNSWAKGKSEWARFKKVQTLEAAVDKAGRAKGGFAAGLRSQFNRILDNPKRQRGFTKAELDAMRKFADGGTMQKLVELATAFKGIPGAAAMFSATGGNIPLAVAAWGAGMGAKGAVNQGARGMANTMRASAALPNGVPQLPPPLPVLSGSMGVGASGANPLLSDQHDVLSRSFGGR